MLSIYFIFELVFVLVATIVVVVMVRHDNRKRDKSATAFNPANLPLKTNQSTPMTESLRKEQVRLVLEDLYHENRIDLPLLNDISAKLKLSPNIGSTSSTTPAQQPEPIERPAASVVTPTTVVRSATPAHNPTYVTPSVPPVSSGFFSADNIKTMLIAGCTLLILSSYLLVRSHWFKIPPTVKCGFLIGLTLLINFIGRKLMRAKNTPKTAETLIMLSFIFIPFNVYAINYYLLSSPFDLNQAWGIGAWAMALAAFFTMDLLPTWGTGLLQGFGFIVGTALLARGAQRTECEQMVAASIATLIVTGPALFSEWKSAVKSGLSTAIHASNAIFLLLLLKNQLFTTELLPLAISTAIVGLVYALFARKENPLFAYLAGAGFIYSAILLLRYFEIPTYRYGLALIPMSLFLLWRAWHFEKTSRASLGQPYFVLGQFTLAGSILSLLPNFNASLHQDFFGMILTIGFITSIYLGLALLYENPIFTFASGTTVFFLAWSAVCHSSMDFFGAVMIFANVATLLFVLSLVTFNYKNNLLSTPLLVMGLGVLTITLSLLASQWGFPLLSEGSLKTGLEPQQLNTALIVALLTVVAYVISVFVQRSALFFYPALISATMAYFFSLEKLGVPINVYMISWIVGASMLMFYVFMALKANVIARCFAIWAELIFVTIFGYGLATPNANILNPLLVCSIAFLPALLIGHVDLVLAFLTSLYALHGQWFFHPWDYFTSDFFTYSVHLLILNCTVVLIRTMVGSLHPQNKLWPYKTFVGIFMIVSLAGIIGDKEHAWQIYLAYGILSILVSQIHYEGKYNIVSYLLLLMTYELFLWNQDITLLELKIVPAGLFLLAWGYSLRETRVQRDVLYFSAQFILYVPLLLKSVSETWEFHGIFLGVMSLALMLVGIKWRNKALTFVSFSVMGLNALIQSFQFFTAVPRWIYLALGGTTLLSLGGLFEFRREKLLSLKDHFTNQFESWE